MRHPPFDRFVHYVEGTLDADDRAAVEAHLPCPACEKTLRELTTILESFKIDLPEPSAPVVDAAITAFTAGPWRRPSLRERIVALLQFDSRQMTAAVGVRGAARSVQMLFVADDIDFDLQILPGESGTLLGQALPQDNQLARVAGQPVRLMQGEALCAQTATDETGQFAFRDLSAGTYEVVVGLADRHNVALTGVVV